MLVPKIDESGLMMLDDERCLGYLLNLQGVSYDAEHGSVLCTAEQAQRHNQVFDEMIVSGLDRCEVGHGQLFYVDGNLLKTFLGTVLGCCEIHGQTVRFDRGLQVYRGVRQTGEDCCFMKRER